MYIYIYILSLGWSISFGYEELEFELEFELGFELGFEIGWFEVVIESRSGELYKLVLASQD